MSSNQLVHSSILFPYFLLLAFFFFFFCLQPTNSVSSSSSSYILSSFPPILLSFPLPLLTLFTSTFISILFFYTLNFAPSPTIIFATILYLSSTSNKAPLPPILLSFLTSCLTATSLFTASSTYEYLVFHLFLLFLHLHFHFPLHLPLSLPIIVSHLHLIFLTHLHLHLFITKVIANNSSINISTTTFTSTYDTTPPLPPPLGLSPHIPRISTSVPPTHTHAPHSHHSIPPTL